MATIHSINRPEPMIWICDCGCSTFMLRSDNAVECANCGDLTDGPDGGWLVASEDQMTRHDEGDTFRDVQGNGSVDFARRRLERMASDPDAAVVVVVSRGGSVSCWSEAETPEQVEWAKDKLKAAAGLIQKRGEGQ